MTFADFQSDGTTTDSNEAFKILHKAGAIDELNAFKTLGCKLSVPGDLCGFSLISSFLIPFIVIAIEGIIRRLVSSANRFLTDALTTCLIYPPWTQERYSYSVSLTILLYLSPQIGQSSRI